MKKSLLISAVVALLSSNAAFAASWSTIDKADGRVSAFIPSKSNPDAVIRCHKKGSGEVSFSLSGGAKVSKQTQYEANLKVDGEDAGKVAVFAVKGGIHHIPSVSTLSMLSEKGSVLVVETKSGETKKDKEVGLEGFSEAYEKVVEACK